MSSLKVRTNQQVTDQVHHHEKVRGSTLQILPFITGLDMYHVAGLDMYQQLTMDSTEDAAVFNAVDGKAAVNEYKAMQWTSGVKWSCKRNSEL